MKTNSVTPGFSKAILHILPALNVNVDRDLVEQIQQFPSEGRLPMALQDALWQALIELKDNELGLKIALSLKPDSYDTLGFLLFSCATLGDAVDSLIAYSALIGEGGKFSKSHNELGWRVSFEAFFTTPTPIRIEAVLACVACGAKWISGAPIKPKVVAFTHPQQGKLSTYQAIFGDAKLLFSAPSNYLLYHNDDWQLQQRSVNQAVQQQMQSLAEQQLKQLQPQTMVDKINAILTKQPNLKRRQISSLLAISERHLNRKLADQGYSYKTLSDEIRKNLAEKLIKQGSANQAHLALYFGYADESAFAKAFRRWTGLGFKEYKQKIGNKDDIK
ncbi:AraC family transcriptional regulator ligand-binding domain-containing protein [Pseudoalteromonas mariniglutinosa]|uniref:AraC family transcriptional regulator n=1 Tax=Pseudoalteromonas mariniglutinosa TaxID=206042 RepID=UPI00384D9EB9